MNKQASISAKPKVWNSGQKLGETMDNKTWLWRKKSSEKNINGAEKVDLSSKVTEEEVQSLLTDKAELEKDVKSLNDKLSSALAKCDAKNDLVKKHAQMAQEAFAGWEKAEAVAVSLKQELDVAIQQRVAGEERLMNLDAALKECMQQLRFVREEQEKRIHDAVVKTSREFEKTQMVLEERLAETSKKLGKLDVENTHFGKALLVKEKLIEELTEQKMRAEEEINALMTRLNSREKDNDSLKYEVRVLEKELEIRNEEREFNRRTSDASHKQHLEGVKKIAKLESECQRLRVLIRKRLPGPAAWAKMKNEVEMLGGDAAEMRKKKLNSSPAGFMVDFSVDKSLDTPTKKINFLSEQLFALDEENKSLKETLSKKMNELQFSKSMYARTASKLSQVESRLEDSSKGQTTKDLTRSSIASQEFSLPSMSDIGSDDKASCADSWASASISELELFKNGKQKGTRVSDISLMDDFVEMEKLAIVSVDKLESSHISSDEVNATGDSLKRELSGSSSEALGKEIVSVFECLSDKCNSDQEIQTKGMVIHKGPGWLQDIMKIILEQNRITQRTPDEILEDIKVSMAYIKNSNPTEFPNVRKSSNHLDASNASHVSSYISWTNKSSVMDSSDRFMANNSPLEKGNPQFHKNLSKSICKIIELIEGISLPSSDHTTPEAFSETPTSYVVRAFQWKTSELSSVLQKFIHSCNDLLNGKANLDEFTCDLTSALDWIMNHCFSIQDVSSMKDEIKKHYGWDDTHSETEESHSNVIEDNRRLKGELVIVESAKKALEGRLQSAIDRSDCLMNRLQESEKTIASLQTELETLKESKRMIEDQMGNYKLKNEDLDTQLTNVKFQLYEARQEFASLEVELDNRKNCCEELEATCLELQLQMESAMKNENPSHDMEREEKQLRTDWEITAASEKLAECQETILTLGKQLKALASPREAAIFDKVISTPSDTTTTPTTNNTIAIPKKKTMNQQRSSLLDRMLAEDDAQTNDLRSPKTKEMVSSSNLQKPPVVLDYNFDSGFGSNVATGPPERSVDLNGIKHQDGRPVGSLAIVPTKKRGGGGLWRKLMWRKKKGNSKKTGIAFAAELL